MSRQLVTLLCGLFVILVTTAWGEQGNTGRIQGKLQAKGGGALSGGLVFFFNDSSGPPPSPDRYWRVPDEIVTLDEEGKFAIDLIEGKYYLGAIKRSAGRDVGPPLEGDLFFTSVDAKGAAKTYQIKKGDKVDLGTIVEATPYKKKAVKEGLTAIEGTVLDPEKKPVAGALVFAFLTPTMVGKPLFVSERTGADGKFQLRVSGGGSYYLKVKDIYGGGPPKTGGVIGSYGEEAPVAAAVKTGETLRNIDIRVLRFPGQGQQRQ